jgi:small subunit ribosomal protein S15
MLLSKEDKAAIVKKFGKGEKDSGTTEVQIAILTERINRLTGHFEGHK